MDTTAIVIVVVTAVVPVIAMAWVRRWMRSQQPPNAALSEDPKKRDKSRG